MSVHDGAGKVGLHHESCRPVLLTTWLLAASAAVCTAGHAYAGPLVHMKALIWGCVDPNVTQSLNYDGDPRRSDSVWVGQMSARGKCVTISPWSAWEVLSQDHNGITYVGYRGKIGKPGSFWVPTAAIDFTAPTEIAPPPAVDLAVR